MSNARIMGRIDAAFVRDGHAAFMVNYVSLDGAIPSGKFEVAVGHVDSTGGAVDDVRDGLAALLNAKHPGHSFRARDIIGCSI